MPPEVLALGPWIVGIYLLITFADKTLLPFLTRHVLPLWSKSARDRQAAQQQEAERQAAQQREMEAERQRREDRLFGIIEANTRALGGLESAIAGLEGAMEGMNNQVARQSETIHDLALDVSGLYGKIGEPRPSRARQRPAAAESGK